MNSLILNHIIGGDLGHEVDLEGREGENQGAIVGVEVGEAVDRELGANQDRGHILGLATTKGRVLLPPEGRRAVHNLEA